MMSEKHIFKRNSYGERLYHDADGNWCNLRGMLTRAPEWVVTRFELMMDESDAKDDRIAELEVEVARLRAKCISTADGVCVGPDDVVFFPGDATPAKVCIQNVADAGSGHIGQFMPIDMCYSTPWAAKSKCKKAKANNERA